MSHTLTYCKNDSYNVLGALVFLILHQAKALNPRSAVNLFITSALNHILSVTPFPHHSFLPISSRSLLCFTSTSPAPSMSCTTPSPAYIPESALPDQYIGQNQEILLTAQQKGLLLKQRSNNQGCVSNEALRKEAWYPNVEPIDRCGELKRM